MLLSKETRRALDQIKDDTSSLICLRDTDSYSSTRTSTTTRSSILNVMFNFDRELFNSKVYQETMRSIIRRTIRGGRNDKRQDSIAALETQKLLWGSTKAKNKAKLRNQEIESQLKKDRKEQSLEINLLLLGARGSGKSTAARQMKLSADGSYTRSERESFKEAIFNYIVQAMREILDAMESLDLSLDSPENEHHVRTIRLQPPVIEEPSLSPKSGHAIEALWKDKAVQEFCRKSEEYQIDSSES